MPFTKDLAPSMLATTAAHAEAVARIGWCVQEAALGVITGEVGAGKTVAVRAALAKLDPSRHTIIYIGNPAVGARGLYAAMIAALGGTPRFHKAALIPQAQNLLAAEHDERGKHVIVVVDLCRPRSYPNWDRGGGSCGLIGGARGVESVRIITGLRGRRGACRVAGSGRVACWRGRSWRVLVP
jgi:hypothetical protein